MKKLQEHFNALRISYKWQVKETFEGQEETLILELKLINRSDETLSPKF